MAQAWLLFPGHPVKAVEPNLIGGDQSEAYLYLAQQQQQLEQIAIQKQTEKQNELKASLITKAKKLVGTRQGQCIVAARNFIGAAHADLSGAARDVKINSLVPELGAIVKLATKHKNGHVAVVIDFDADSILVFESNYAGPERASIREVSRTSGEILGYKIIKTKIIV